MANFINNLIEYVGVTDIFPSCISAFKQFSVQETVCLPIAKPDIEHITKVMSEAVVTNTRVIKTPGSSKHHAVSLEGQILTGWKLIVEGEVRHKVEYVADEPTQSVHAAHFNIPFSTFIVLPDFFTPGTQLIVSAFIEDIYAKQIDRRCIFKNITILLTAE